MDSTGLYVFSAIVGIGLSLWIATLAGGDARLFGWGFLGPIGWIIAALRGVQIRLEDGESHSLTSYARSIDQQIADLRAAKDPKK